MSFRFRVVPKKKHRGVPRNRAVHFYEAVLATLAIIIWHFYQVFFDPDAYPMNWAWWDGKISQQHHRNEHPLDMETIHSETKKPETTSGLDEKDSAHVKSEETPPEKKNGE